MSEKKDTFKKIMGHYPTGVTIVTSLNQHDKPIGITVNSFASVSLEPLMLLWCIDRGVSTFQDFCSADKFAVHILASDQADACWAFAGKSPNRFSTVNWNLSENNLPIISGALGVLQCQTVNRIDAGDHVVLIGEVISLKKYNKAPLLYFNRKVGPIPNSWSTGNN